MDLPVASSPTALTLQPSLRRVNFTRTAACNPSGVRTESEPDLGAHVTAARPAPKSRCRCGRRGPVRVQQMWQGKPVGVGIPGYRELHCVFVCFVRLRMGSHWKLL